MGGHGWTLSKVTVGFHRQSNTLDVLLRPMSGSELAVDFAGCSWLESRLHVVRGSRHTFGPCEVRVNGEQTLEETPVPTPGDKVCDGEEASHRADVPRLTVPWRKTSQKRLAHQSFNDSGVSLGRRTSPVDPADGPRISPDDNLSARSIRRCVQGLAAEVAGSLGTPTRSRQPRAVTLEQDGSDAVMRTSIRSDDTVSSHSIGGKLLAIVFMFLFE